MVAQALWGCVPEFVSRKDAVSISVEFMEDVRVERPLVAFDDTIPVFIELIDRGVLSCAERAAVTVPVVPVVVAGFVVRVVSIVIPILVVIPVPIVIPVLVVIASLGLPPRSHPRQVVHYRRGLRLHSHHAAEKIGRSHATRLWL